MASIIFEKQEYQEDCVSNIVKVLEGTSNFSDIDSLIKNLQALHKERQIPIRETVSLPKLDVVMETGTGKTFTYIQAMYELNKKFNINRFIIFVPRRAIREGVIQNINLTQNYFKNLYNNTLSVKSYTGDGDDDEVKSFLQDDDFSVLILTSHSISAKNKRDRVLARAREYLDGAKSILNALEEINPAIIIDEPHLLKGDVFMQAYKEHFSKCLCLRFGATFPEKKALSERGDEKKVYLHQSLMLSNVVYSMDSMSAFRNRLVKQIQVIDVGGEIGSINFTKHSKGSVDISYSMDNKPVYKTVKVKDDDLGLVTGLDSYNGVFISKIKNKKVFLKDENKGETRSVDLGTQDYQLSEPVTREMIRATIKQHFEKEKKLFPKGIKTLSLFFIRRIKDYDGDDAKVKRIFDEEYREERGKVIKEAQGNYKKYLEQDFDKDNQLNPIRYGYFASKDSSSEDSEEVAKQVSLILRKKEDLLSFKEPLRFIFSVWALQEGWDNPNVFNVCKLAPSKAKTSRRQQVGRGLRIAVNQSGVRQTIERCEDDENFYNINTLDVVVSSLEGDYISGLQDEINASSYSFGGDILSLDDLKSQGLTDPEAVDIVNMLEKEGYIERSGTGYKVLASISEFLILNKEILIEKLSKEKYENLCKYFDTYRNDRQPAKRKTKQIFQVRQEQFFKFEELWQAINREAKIVYENVDEDTISQTIAEKFNKENISKKKMLVRVQKYNHDTNMIEPAEDYEFGDLTFFERFEAFSSFCKDFAMNEKLPIRFVLKMLNRIDKDLIQNDPRGAYERLVKVTKETIHKEIIQSVGYNFSSDLTIRAESNVFRNVEGKFIGEIDASLLGWQSSEKKPHKNYLYDLIRFDSKIEEDASLPSGDPNKISDLIIKVFAKLPKKISIPTPYKSYQPDFAYLMEGNGKKKIYFVVETKGYSSESDIPEKEQVKINYARKFFKALNESADLKAKGVEVLFEQRINKKKMIELLNTVRKNNEKQP